MGDSAANPAGDLAAEPMSSLLLGADSSRMDMGVGSSAAEGTPLTGNAAAAAGSSLQGIDDPTPHSDTNGDDGEAAAEAKQQGNDDITQETSPSEQKQPEKSRPMVPTSYRSSLENLSTNSHTSPSTPPSGPSSSSEPSNELQNPIFLEFMSFRDHQNYIAKEGVPKFSDKRLEGVNPDQVKSWLRKKAYGRRALPTKTGYKTLAHYKDVISNALRKLHEGMPWNSTSAKGDPTTASVVLELLSEVRRLQTVAETEPGTEAEPAPAVSTSAIEPVRKQEYDEFDFIPDEDDDETRDVATARQSTTSKNAPSEGQDAAAADPGLREGNGQSTQGGEAGLPIASKVPQPAQEHQVAESECCSKTRQTSLENANSDATNNWRRKDEVASAGAAVVMDHRNAVKESRGPAPAIQESAPATRTSMRTRGRQPRESGRSTKPTQPPPKRKASMRARQLPTRPKKAATKRYNDSTKGAIGAKASGEPPLTAEENPSGSRKAPRRSRQGTVADTSNTRKQSAERSRMQDAGRKKQRREPTVSSVSTKCQIEDPVLAHPIEELDPPQPPPAIPHNLKGKWSYDEKSRVLLADFRELAEIPEDDKWFLVTMMERDDISIVSEGVLNWAITEIPLEEIAAAFNDKSYHKFRRYDRVEKDGKVVFQEGETLTSMKFQTFVSYLKLRYSDNTDKSFDFKDERGKKCHIDNVLDVAFHMVDCDLRKNMPGMDSEYMSNFKMQECLPGGSFCMAGAISGSARPFGASMLDVSPGRVSPLSNCGAGTVDLGFTGVVGYHEIVMLRRLPQDHKTRAAEHVSYDVACGASPREVDSSSWPTTDQVKKWTDQNYCPSVFILRPGQHLHINKDRLHSVRKLLPESLPETDCHAVLRRDLLATLSEKASPESFMCMSIAFEWMFLGATVKGIEKEVGTSLSCSEICQKRKIAHHGISAAALLKLGSLLSGEYGSQSLFNNCIEPSADVLRRGILSSLSKVVENELCEPRPTAEPDNHDDADDGVTAIDPYGSDYTCKLCFTELGNRYFHCMGCEALLQKDFNICRQCFAAEDYYRNIQMHPSDTSMVSDLNHTGTRDKRNKGRMCSCKKGICFDCKMCKECSCQCHHNFEQRCRFFAAEELEAILAGCQAKVGKCGEATGERLLDD